mgnify:CR=1 FL=1
MLNKIKTLKEIKNKTHHADDFYLKKVTDKDCNKNYLKWLDDKKINKYLEIRFKKQSIKSIKNFVKKINIDNTIILFGIFIKKKHVGNIKIDINWDHNYAILGYLIGDSNYHHKNITTRSIKVCTNLCFKFLKLRFCLASTYDTNVGSRKVLEKNGFKQVSKIKKMYKINNTTFADEITYKLDNSR